MGKSSGWIYEGHAPLMAKRQGRRGEKRRRLVGGAVILALTIAVFAFARSSSGPDDEESLGWGDSPSDDDFDVPARRFGRRIPRTRRQCVRIASTGMTPTGLTRCTRRTARWTR